MFELAQEYDADVDFHLDGGYDVKDLGFQDGLATDVPTDASVVIVIGPDSPFLAISKLTLAQAAPVLPYLLMVLILIFRPKGLMGTREG